MGPQAGAVGGVVGGDAARVVGEEQHPVRPGDGPGDVRLDPDPPHLGAGVGVEGDEVGVLAGRVRGDEHGVVGHRGRGHHAPLEAAFGQRRLPQDLAAVAVERPVRPGLVADPDRVGAVHGEQVRHRPDVGVEARGQGHRPGVARRELAVPHLLSGVQVEGDQAVAAGRGGEAVGLAGADVEHAALAVDRRRRPHRHARALAGGLVGHVEAPGLLARPGVEGDHGAPERGRVAGHEHLEAADAGHDQAVGHDRRAEHDGLGIRVDVGLPGRLAGGAVEGDDAGVERPDVHLVVVERHRSADVAAVEIVGPLLLTGGGVEGAHVAGPVADVHGPVGDRRGAGDPGDAGELPGRGEVGGIVGADRGVVGGAGCCRGRSRPGSTRPPRRRRRRWPRRRCPRRRHRRNRRRCPPPRRTARPPPPRFARPGALEPAPARGRARSGRPPRLPRVAP